MRCPICKTPVADEGTDRPRTYPFCSERCKLVDLGRWLDGKYQIPVVDREDRGSDGVGPRDRPPTP